jgi:hypothetical protein
MKPPSSAYDAAWDAIEKEKRRDRAMRRTSIIAWSTTFVVLLIFAGIMVQRIAVAWHRSMILGIHPPDPVYDAALPLIVVIGVLSLLIATLATIGIFLRLRTASLSEIQLRLANLEDMLRADSREAPEAQNVAVTRRETEE